jgi:AcrR family transcriptional regulator
MTTTAAKPDRKHDSSAKPEPAKQERTGRLSADDWASAALDLIAEQGVAAVAVEPLARRLGVTKGSFYWHFPSREALLVAALERWEKMEQDLLFGELEPINDPRARLRALFNLVAHEYKSHVVYSELIKAMDHPAVQPVIGRVSERRLDYLTASFRQAGLSRTDARHRAQLLYSAYVGFLQLNLQLHQTRMQHDEFEAYVEHMAATLIPNP